MGTRCRWEWKKGGASGEIERENTGRDNKKWGPFGGRNLV